MMEKPRYVALCGAPESGKTTLGNIIVNDFGARFVDDGFCLRSGVASIFSIPLSDFYDIERKKDEVVVCGKTYTKRQLLGDLGNLLEGYYGDQIMPELALASLEDDPGVPFYVFGSVRKNQGLTYRNNGIIIEVKRDGKIPVNDFDHYDESLVDYKIYNNGSLEELRRSAHTILSAWFSPCSDFS